MLFNFICNNMQEHSRIYSYAKLQQARVKQHICIIKHTLTEANICKQMQIYLHTKVYQTKCDLHSIRSI